MGTYTELIFGATLKEETPQEVIECLKFMTGVVASAPPSLPFKKEQRHWFLESSSYYFGVSDSVTKLWKDEVDNQWRLSSRCNTKNYNDEIETFLEWIKPFVESGSGDGDMYAIVMYEECYEPKIYYLREGE